MYRLSISNTIVDTSGRLFYDGTYCSLLVASEIQLRAGHSSDLNTRGAAVAFPDGRVHDTAVRVDDCYLPGCSWQCRPFRGWSRLRPVITIADVLIVSAVSVNVTVPLTASASTMDLPRTYMYARVFWRTVDLFVCPYGRPIITSHNDE